MPTPSASPALRLAVFDLDGTLIDSAHMIHASMARAFGELHMPAPAATDVRRVIGLPLEVAIARLAPGRAAADYPHIADAYKDSFAALRAAGTGGEILFPGVIETLNALVGSGWLLAIATGKSMRGLNATLDRFGLHGHFVALRTADHGPGKPAPDMLLSALAETGVEAPAAVMIGDTTFDMEMARAARVAGIGVGWGYHPREDLTAAGAAMVVDAMTAVPAAAEDVLAAGVTP